MDPIATIIALPREYGQGLPTMLRLEPLIDKYILNMLCNLNFLIRRFLEVSSSKLENLAINHPNRYRCPIKMIDHIRLTCLKYKQGLQIISFVRVIYKVLVWNSHNDCVG